jgi:hypothetical protein
MGFLTMGIGLAVAVYFLCEGLGNTIKPGSNNEFGQIDEVEQEELIKASELHYYLGVSRVEAEEFMKAHSNLPRICINGKAYYSKTKLREWLLNMSN